MTCKVIDISITNIYECELYGGSFGRVTYFANIVWEYEAIGLGEGRVSELLFGSVPSLDNTLLRPNVFLKSTDGSRQAE